MDEPIVTPGGITVPSVAISWNFSRSGGPGGQHVNTTDSRVELLCDLTLLDGDTAAIGRIRSSMGDSVRIVSSSSRSQYANRVAAIKRLVSRLDTAARPRRKRRSTTPSRSSIETRLKEKKERSARKTDRSWKPDE